MKKPCGQSDAIHYTPRNDYEAFFQTSPDLLLIVDAEEGRILTLNNAAERILGYAVTDLNGRYVTDFFREETEASARWIKEIAASEGGWANQKLQTAANEFFPVDLTAVPVTFQGGGAFLLTLHDATDRILAEESVRQVNEELEKRVEMRTHALQQEIAERKNAEEAMRGSEQRYRALFEFSCDAIFLINEGCFVDCNQRTLDMFNCSYDEILGETPFNFSPPRQPDGRDSITAGSERLRAALAGKPQQYEWEFCRLDGKVFQTETSLNRVDLADRTFILATVRDITRRKQVEAERSRLEAQLLQTQRLETIGTLAGGIAHDFNNILTPILGYTEMALRDTDEDSQIRRGLQEVVKAANRAKDLVQQILDYTHHVAQEHQPVGLHLIVKEALRFLRASLPSTIVITEAIDRDIPPVMADPSQLHQVIMNLCTNAAYAMRENGGALCVSLAELGDLSELYEEGRELDECTYLRLSVSDTGTGIDIETMKHIFEPFFTTKQSGEGTGLGLSVVHGIVLSHGGEIKVDSQVGVGSSFHVYLPCLDMSLPHIAQGDEAVEGGDERILFVDDDSFISSMADIMLKSFGYDVVAHTGSIQALEVFKNEPDTFDLVMTDQLMPGMTGLQLIEEIKKSRPDIPVILITGFSDAMANKSPTQHGINEVMRKPLSRRDVGAAIRRVLDAARAGD
ncbi:MAG: PAS domain-containing sensor histidine kinase [Spartobacteria bacterium]|nr:PAS domain-containing sensor histidine kinase [Spartobacteria bacterium]